MTKNDRWKTFRKKVAFEWKLLKYGWCHYIPESVIATLSLTLWIYAIVSVCKGFGELAIVCASVAAALLVGLMLSVYRSRRVLADGGLLNIYARKILAEKWSTDLDGIKMGDHGGIYLIVVTHVGFLFSAREYDTRHEFQAEQLREAIYLFKKYRYAKVHYIKVSDLLKLSFDAEEIRHELE